MQHCTPRSFHLVALPIIALLATRSLSAQTTADPRVGLAPGWHDAGSAIRHLRLVSHTDRPAGFVNPNDRGDFGVINTDMAFQGTRLFMGSYTGFQIWDIADPAKPTLLTGYVCPGGQGDVSVVGNLLFHSVEEDRGRVDCGTSGVPSPSSAERFMGVRIFDIRDVRAPKLITQVQSCRGSHTHTVVTDPKDPAHVYIYISGTNDVRPSTELAGCSDGAPATDANSSRFRIDIIKVPLASPGDAKIVASPRIFADRATGAMNGLWKGGDHGQGTQDTGETDQCHDITVYPAMGLAAGACSGNGILLDISNPADPKRIAEVSDNNFAYWHSATFSNDARAVLFTDEWGGGLAPRCQASDRKEWGANAIFRLDRRALTFASYYKLPAAQSAIENCVAHNGSLIPVPGRSILAQAWYQGGLSLVDFSDPATPFEIAFFDRGPMEAGALHLAGYWSTYWYNGHIYGSEIGRGLDVFALEPSPMLSANEIEAARLVNVAEFNPQHQVPIVWPAHPAVARAYLDQLERDEGLAARRIAAIRWGIREAEMKRVREQRRQAYRRLAAQVARDVPRAADAERTRLLVTSLEQLARR
ncbi:MAG: hypothetical protein MUF00_17270 [Gemmatimonadaceae bacterium]|nr:hypothetical protein [Gemmatimonadaceae bacterium]